VAFIAPDIRRPGELTIPTIHRPAKAERRLGAVSQAQHQERAVISQSKDTMQLWAQSAHFDGLVDESCPDPNSGGLKREALTSSPGFDPTCRCVAFRREDGDHRRTADVGFVCVRLLLPGKHEADDQSRQPVGNGRLPGGPAEETISGTDRRRLVEPQPGYQLLAKRRIGKLCRVALTDVVDNGVPRPDIINQDSWPGTVGSRAASAAQARRAERMSS
jgi:hypothetical protein